MLVIVKNEERDIRTSYVPDLKVFLSSEPHTDFTAYDYSDRWVIILSQATRTIKKTKQKFLCGTVIPLDSRYRMNRVLTRKKLQG